MQNTLESTRSPATHAAPSPAETEGGRKTRRRTLGRILDDARTSARPYVEEYKAGRGAE